MAASGRATVVGLAALAGLALVLAGTPRRPGEACLAALWREARRLVRVLWDGDMQGRRERQRATVALSHLARLRRKADELAPELDGVETALGDAVRAGDAVRGRAEQRLNGIEARFEAILAEADALAVVEDVRQARKDLVAHVGAVGLSRVDQLRAAFKLRQNSF
jgi:hypothetical protein